MKAGRTVVLLLAVLGLGGWIYMVERHQKSGVEEEQENRKVFRMDPESLTALRIRHPDYDVTLNLEGERWMFEHPQGAVAQQAKVMQLLSRLRVLDRGELITAADMKQRGQRLADFGLAVPQAVIEMTDSRGSKTYDVGDPDPLGSQLYIKERNTQNVMLVSSDLLDLLPASPDLFRDPRLFAVPFEELEALELASPDKRIRLERRDNNNWVMVEPLQSSLDAQRVEALFAKLKSAQVDGFLNQPETSELQAMERDGNRFIRLYLRGLELPIELQLGALAPSDPGMILARGMDQEGLYLVSPGLKSIADTEVDALRERRLLSQAVTEVQRWNVKGDAQQLLLEKRDAGWSMLEPAEGAPLSESRVTRMLDLWEKASVERFLEKNEGLQPVRVVELRYADGSTEQFEILEGEVPGGRSWVRKQGSEEVLQVLPDLLRFSPTDPLPYLSRNVMQVDPDSVIRIRQLREEVQSLLLRRETEWEVEGSEGLEPNVEAVDALLKRCASLQALRLLAWRPESLEAFGLDQPRLRLSLGLGGSSPGNRTLLIADMEGESPAMLQGGDLVFAMSEETLKILAAELSQATRMETQEPGVEDAPPAQDP